jgi:hypothetical protein
LNNVLSSAAVTILRGGEVMNRQLERSVHDLVSSYLDHKLTLDQFRDRFAAATWDQQGGILHESPLASEVELRLAEFTNGDCTEDELQEKLRSLLVAPTSAALD